MSRDRHNRRGKSSRTTLSVGRAAVVLGLVAFLVRLIYIIELSKCPFFDHPVIDAETYLSQAAAIAEGDIWGKGPDFINGAPYWQPPGYQYFLSIFVYIFGLRFFPLHLIGVLTGTGTTIMTTLIGGRVFGRRAGILAGIFAAFCGPLIFFDGEFLVVGLYTFVLTIFLFLSIRNRDSWIRWFLAGVIFGFAIVILPTVLTTAPLIIAWALVRNGSNKKRVALIAALVVGAILPVAPVTIRNTFVGKEPVLVSTNAGLNFYIGNHPEDSFDLQRIRPGKDWDRLVGLPEQKGIVSPSGRSSWFFRQALTSIANDPPGWLLLKLKGVAIFLNGHEVMRNQDPYFFRRYSRLLSAVLWEKLISFPMGLIFPLAILGITLAFKKSPQFEDRSAARFLAIFIMWYGATVALFFVTSRYRLPVIPAALCFAAYAAVWLKDNISNRQWNSIGWSAGLLITATIFCNMPAFRVDLYAPGENEFMIARSLYDKGNYSLARMEYLECLKKSPENTIALNDLGNIALFDNNPAEALEWYDKAVKLDPLYEDAYSNRGVALSKLGRYAEAAESLWKAIELAPEWDMPRKNLQNIAPFLKEAEDLRPKTGSGN